MFKKYLLNFKSGINTFYFNKKKVKKVFIVNIMDEARRLINYFRTF